MNTRPKGPERVKHMDKDRIKGKADEAAGRLKRQAGEWTGDTESQVKGGAQEIKGKVQNQWGKTKDAARDAVDDAKKRHEEDAKRHQEEDAKRHRDEHDAEHRRKDVA